MEECNLAKNLRKYSNVRYSCYEDFEERIEIIDDLCYKIATCNKNCDNEFCKGLQISWETVC